MTTRTCNVRNHVRVISRTDKLDTPPHAEMREARIHEILCAELERELLPANDGMGGFDPRNMGM